MCKIDVNVTWYEEGCICLFNYQNQMNVINQLNNFLTNEFFKMGDEGEYNAVVTIVGDTCVGKTSMVMTFAENEFPQEYVPDGNLFTLLTITLLNL